MKLNPGSYIFTKLKAVLEISSSALAVNDERLLYHPDFSMVSGQKELSLGIEQIRNVSHFLRSTPAISEYKVVVIEDFHFATIEAQNAFLKTFEEPPVYAYIFLVTPYIDRLLKTIVSRAQVMGETKLESRIQSYDAKRNLEVIQRLSIGERLLWLEETTKSLSDKPVLKQWLMETVNQFLAQGIELLKSKKISPESLDYLKEAKWKIEQGFPLPKLLLEGFLVTLG